MEIEIEREGGREGGRGDSSDLVGIIERVRDFTI